MSFINSWGIRTEPLLLSKLEELGNCPDGWTVKDYAIVCTVW